VLLGLQAIMRRCLFAEAKEGAQFKAKVGQRPENSARMQGRMLRVHIYIVSRYN
jgi:hypothetical protein